MHAKHNVDERRIVKYDLEPFESGSNNVPATTLCRTIEINYKTIRDEKNLQTPIQQRDHILY